MKRKRRQERVRGKPLNLLLMLAAAGFLFAGIAEAQTDSIYVRIDGVGGDSLDQAHRNWIEAYAIDYGYSAPSDPGQGAPHGGGPTATSLAFLKIIDSATVDIISILLQRSPIQTADIDVCRPGSAQQDCYVSLHLEQVKLVSRALAGTACVDPATCPGSSSESIELAYGRITWTYRTFDAAGQVTGTYTDTSVWDPPPP